MFSIEEIHQAEEKVKSGADFPKFVKEIKSLGVVRNDVFVINGLSTYYGNDDHTVQSGPSYEDLLIETETSLADFQEALKAHQSGLSDYQTFCRQAASAGIEKWVTDLKEMTVTYYDTEGNEVIKENIPD
jgi:uncharacterized protein YbcV (DUF1398 family)